MSNTSITKIFSELESAVSGGFVTDISQVRGAEDLVAATTISPFAGFVTIGSIRVEDTPFEGEGGDVLYHSGLNMFLLTDGKKYYKDWADYSLYNTSNSTNILAKNNKLFSYNGSHYMIINGSLQDISNIESVLKVYTDNKFETATNYTEVYSNTNLEIAKKYADDIFADKTAISPFDGFINLGDMITEDATFVGEGGDVLYHNRLNMFVLTDGKKYYKDWANYSLYNTSNSANILAKSNKLFSYNGSHYMIINGSLQDISNIESVLKVYTDDKFETAKTYAREEAIREGNIAESHANQYTDLQFERKIKYLSNEASWDATTPEEGVLYLIGEEY